MFSPVGPVAPDAPCRPGKPGVPGGPIGPVKPVQPRNPCGPVNPRGPGGPPRPGGPVCPTTPVEPVYIYIIETSSHARARVAWLVMHCTAEPRHWPTRSIDSLHRARKCELAAEEEEEFIRHVTKQ